MADAPGATHRRHRRETGTPCGNLRPCLRNDQSASDVLAAAGREERSGRPVTMPVTLTSSAFGDGDVMPHRFTCDGENLPTATHVVRRARWHSQLRADHGGSGRSSWDVHALGAL